MGQGVVRGSSAAQWGVGGELPVVFHMGPTGRTVAVTTVLWRRACVGGGAEVPLSFARAMRVSAWVCTERSRMLPYTAKCCQVPPWQYYTRGNPLSLAARAL